MNEDGTCIQGLAVCFGIGGVGGMHVAMCGAIYRCEVEVRTPIGSAPFQSNSRGAARLSGVRGKANSVMSMAAFAVGLQQSSINHLCGGQRASVLWASEGLVLLATHDTFTKCAARISRAIRTRAHFERL